MRVNPYPPFVDFLVVLLAVVLVQQIKQNGAITPAQYVISASWDAHSDSDVDLYGQNSDDAAFYNKKQSGVMFLDRDSRGFVDDKVSVDGKETFLAHHETISIRGFKPGVYDFGLHLYVDHDEYVTTENLKDPIKVHVEVMRINPRVERVYEGDVILTHVGDARNFWSTTLDSQGDWKAEPAPIEPIALKYVLKR